MSDEGQENDELMTADKDFYDVTLKHGGSPVSKSQLTHWFAEQEYERLYRVARKSKESKKQSEQSVIGAILLVLALGWLFRPKGEVNLESKPPFNAEYLLYLFLRREEREAVIGDLVECYGRVFHRFGKRRADIWFYKQVAISLFPLLRRAILRIAAFAWLGRVLRRLIS